MENCVRFLEWRENQKGQTRGGTYMYDIIGCHKWLTEGELFDYWLTNLK